MGKIKVGILLAAMVALSFSTPLYASEGTDSAWKVSVVPYAWLVGIDGTVTVKGRDADVNANFSDILNNLDIAGQLQVEAGKDGAGIFIQPNYLKLSTDATYTVPGSSVKVKAKAKSETLFIEFGGFYRVAEKSSGDASRPFTLDLIGGLRYWDFSNELKVNVPAVELTFKVKKDTAVLDPFIGYRMRTYLADKFLFSGRIDVGGLGTGSSSDFTYNVVALFGYDMTRNATLFGGYRVLSLEYGDSINGFNAMMHGPMVGAQFTF